MVCIFTNIVSIYTWELFWKKKDGDNWYYHFFYYSNWNLMIVTLYFLLNIFNKHILFLQKSSFISSIIILFTYWICIYTSSRCPLFSLCFIVQVLVHLIIPFFIFYDIYYVHHINFYIFDIISILIIPFLYHIFTILYYKKTQKLPVSP